MILEHNHCAVVLVILSGSRAHKLAGRIHWAVELAILSGDRANMQFGHIRLVAVPNATGSCTDLKHNHCCTRALSLVLAVASTSCCYLDD